MTAPGTLVDIRNKFRRITGRPNPAQISDLQIDQYINTYYLYDLSEQLRLESFRVNYQFMTNANQPVYDFPKELYLTNMPPIYVGGYQSYLTQSRENFFRINPQLNLLQQQVATGNGTTGIYNFGVTNTPVMPGFKRNPPGAYMTTPTGPITSAPASVINWNVVVSALDVNGQSMTLVDDGGCQATGVHANTGLLFWSDALDTDLGSAHGIINYITGRITQVSFPRLVPAGNPINAQYIPYVASRPQTACFYQDQIILYPVPDQAYTVSFEAFKYPTAFLSNVDAPPNPAQYPQLQELWQLLAFGASDKIFADNGDLESLNKFRPLLEEQLKLVQRRTIVQYTSERAATIYTEQSGLPQYPFGNLFGGF